ncbi:MAG: cytochrome c oxidase assembly protein, partial [Gemmatimonadaceae bacterium]
PGVAWMLHLGDLLFWHIPTAYGWTLRSDSIHALEHASFVGTAILFWWAVLQPTGRRRLSYGMSVLYVITAGMVMSALGAILTLAPSAWYVGYLTTTGIWNLTPLQDQQLGGLIMWIPGSLVYLGAACWFFVKWIGPDSESRSV